MKIQLEMEENQQWKSKSAITKKFKCLENKFFKIRRCYNDEKVTSIRKTTHMMKSDFHDKS